MDSQKALSQTFNQTLLGLIIGWGGFSTIIPNVLGAAGEIVDLGSFRSLRISSIIFFLFPIKIFLCYWWLRGASFYHYYLRRGEAQTGDKHEIMQEYYFPHYRLFFIGWFFLMLCPVVIFVENEFFLYGWPSWLNRIAITIYYYTALGAVGLLLLSGLLNSTDRSKDPRLIKAHILVFSLHIILGICIAAFIEPWMMYQSSYMWHFAIAFVIYFAVGLFCYQRSTADKKVPIFRRLAVCLIILSFIIGNFPMVNYSHWCSLILSVIAFGTLITYMVLRKAHTNDLKGLVSLAIGLLLVMLVLTGVQFYVIRKVTEKSNYSYYLKRKEAHDKISDKKLYPLFFVKEGRSEVDGIAPLILDGKVTPLGYKLASEIEKKSHALSSFLNGRTSDPAATKIQINGKQLELTNWISTSDDSRSVRHIFYEIYDESPIKVIQSQDSINKFYTAVYQYLEDKFVEPHLLMLPKRKLKAHQKFFHPINYYTETLGHYRSEQKSATRAMHYMHEYRTIDSLQLLNEADLSTKLATIEEKLLDQLSGITEWKSAMFALEKNELTKRELINLLLGKNQNGKRVAEPRLSYLLALKTKQYSERFSRAQIIFRSYLEDTQRIGLFALISSVSILLMLYWVHKVHDDRKSSGQKQSEEELPGGYLNIAVIVFAVLIVHIARPLKPENINPENPYWMMDISNWYAKTSVQQLLSDDEPSSTKTMEDLLRDIKESNKKLTLELSKNSEALNAANANPASKERME